MKRLPVVLAALFSISAVAQTATVTKVEPASGPSSGGTEVTITGTNLLTSIQCIVPCPAQVTFGDVTVAVKSESETRLVVVTPPHDPGTVDLTVSVSGREPVRVTHGFTFTADHDDTYEQVLLPVYLDGTVSGAFGSLWKTDFWLHNDAQESVQIAPWPCPPNLVCPPVFPLTKNLPGNATLHNLDPFFHVPNGNPSRMVYLTHGKVSMQLRVADISRSTLNAGTDIPVVRESAMRRGGVAQLMNVPLTNEFRVLLRVYETASTSGEFVVRIYDQTNLDSNAVPMHTLTLSARTTQEGEFRTEAAYAEYDITGLLVLEKIWPAAARLEIVPQHPGSRYWAFASITNNATQLVTLSTPQ
jgi:hypothetical protein